MFRAAEIVALQHELTRRWHEETPCADGVGSGLLGLAARQHLFNFQLWHEEDLARSPDATDATIAQVKRNIDRFNQQRNDAIEQLDEALLAALFAAGAAPAEDAPLNTETAGSCVDRLSIMALRIYHMDEQARRVDADEEHRRKAAERLARCRLQHADLTQSLEELLGDLTAGRKRLQVYRQMKMYNDPTLNPAIYGARRSH